MSAFLLSSRAVAAALEAVSIISLGAHTGTGKRNIFTGPRLRLMTEAERDYYRPGTSKRRAARLAGRLAARLAARKRATA